MKLSKEEFEEVLMEAAHHTSNIRGGRCVEIHDAFIDNDLEIEGYERIGWIKFNPTDPKTIPPKNTVVLLAIQGLPLEDNICTWQTYLQERHNARGLPGVFTHWRPLPPPPGKEAKCG